MRNRLIITPVILFLIGIFYGSAICNENAAQSSVSPGVIFELLALNRDLPTAAKPKYLSPSSLLPSPDGKILYVGEQTAKQIAVVDLATNNVTKKILLPNDVTGIAVAPDGSKLYATCASDLWPYGMVCVVDPGAGKVTGRIQVGHSACSPVISPDGKTLYVCNQFNNDISVIDVQSSKEIKRIPVVREPYSAGITPDGKVLVVANSLPNQPANDTLDIACQISLINTETNQISKSIPLPVGSHSVFGLTVSPDGKYAFATHLIGQFNLIATEIRQGWIHSNNCAIIDIDKQKLLNDFELDNPLNGLANPWGIQCTADGKFLCIAHSGSNELSIIDLPGVISKVSSIDTSISHEFRFLNSFNNFRKEITVQGFAPRALAVVGNKVYTAGYFGDNIEVFDISMTNSTSSDKIVLGPSQPLTSERMGEFRFNDASLCLQKWQSCQSCHPFTRPDALNWILANSGAGGAGTPKNAKSMLYSWWTAPTNWAGKRNDASESIRMGVQLELKVSPDEAMCTPMDTFLMRLKPELSPYLEKGCLSEAAKRGKTIYFSNKVDCKICHPAPLFTDKNYENAGIPDPFDKNTDWDTPSIIESWRTAPYGHLGSYVTLEEVMKLPSHSNAYKLSKQDFDDLVKYVQSL